MKTNVLTGFIFVQFLVSSKECILGTTTSTNGADNMMRLLDVLFVNYSTKARPSRNYGIPTRVSLDMGVLEMIEMDIRRQVIALHGWVRTSWRDELLRWDEASYGGIKEIAIPQEMIWKPDLAFTNTLHENNFLEREGTLIRLWSDGSVRWAPAFTRDFHCSMDISKFPFDEQTCSIGVWPWISTDKHIVLFTNQTQITLNDFEEPGEFWMRAHDIVPIVYESVGDRYTGLEYRLKLKRKTLYHGISVILPVMLLAIMCCVSFMLSADDSDKLMVALTVLLSVVVFLDVIDDDLPKISDNMACLVIYTSFLMVLGFLAIVGNALVIKTYKAEEKEENKNDDFVSPFTVASETLPGLPAISTHTTEQDVHRRSFVLNKIFLVINVTLIVVATLMMWIYMLS